MRFSLSGRDSRTAARAGQIETGHGSIQTPVFMPVGTVGSVKAVDSRTLRQEAGAQIILGNAYHLYLRPGAALLEAAGGLHRFMGWPGPMLTDSGGYQVFSLASHRTLSEEGVAFRSHLDGSSHFITPESAVDIQRSIGADIMMALDECPAADVSREYARASHEMTLRWAARCKKRFEETAPLYEHGQALFPIVQGAAFADIRRESARRLVDMDFPGYAIGGLSVGEPDHEMYAMVEVVNEILPADKPRYLMGVGTPVNLLENIARGVDMFDCVMPTRNGRNGMLFTTEGIVNIRNRKWRDDFSPLDPGLDAYVSRTFSKAYVRHLFMANEILGLHIASVQNLSLYVSLMRKAREAILGGSFLPWKDETIPRVRRRL